MNDTHESAGDDALVACLLRMAAEKPVSAQEVAIAFARDRVKPKDPPDAWRRWLNPVKQQALHLARQGRLEVVRKGEAIEPDEAKGLVRFRVP